MQIETVQAERAAGESLNPAQINFRRSSQGQCGMSTAQSQGEGLWSATFLKSTGGDQASAATS
jgi:hypothetical protein